MRSSSKCEATNGNWEDRKICDWICKRIGGTIILWIPQNSIEHCHIQSCYTFLNHLQKQRNLVNPLAIKVTKQIPPRKKETLCNPTIFLSTGKQPQSCPSPWRGHSRFRASVKAFFHISTEMFPWRVSPSLRGWESSFPFENGSLASPANLLFRSPFTSAALPLVLAGTASCICGVIACKDIDVLMSQESEA